MQLKPIADRILEQGNDRHVLRQADTGAGRRQGRRRKRTGKGSFIAGALAMLVVVGAVGLLVATSAGPRIAGFLAGLVDSAAADNRSAAADNIFAEHAGRAGLTRCSSLFTGLGEALVGNGTHSAMTRWDESGPNEHAVHSLVGMNFGSAGQEVAAGGVIFAAPVGSGCEGSLTRVVPAPVPCDQMGGQLPQGSMAAADLAGTTVYQLPDGGSAMLVPSAAGCVLVTSVSVRN